VGLCLSLGLKCCAVEVVPCVSRCLSSEPEIGQKPTVGPRRYKSTNPFSIIHHRNRGHGPRKWDPIKMALVDYSSSEEDEKNTIQPATDAVTTLKRKRENETPSDLPPLPSKFHDLYASTTRVSTRDDRSLHGGRKRVTPHIEGNWPTHVYIECMC
jgi:hypothetical protein